MRDSYAKRVLANRYRRGVCRLSISVRPSICRSYPALALH